MYLTIPLSYSDSTDKAVYDAALFGTRGVPDWLSGFDAPKLLEQEAIATHAGPTAATRLAPLIGQALSYWPGNIPLVQGEQVVTEKMACLAQPWAGLAEGTLVFLRITSQARVAFVLPGSLINLATGALSSDGDALWRFQPLARADHPSGHRGMLRATATASAGPSDVKAIVDSALTAITFVGFGINGPWGLALAGASAVAEVLFNAFFNVGKPPIDQVIGDVVTRLLGQQEITDKANAIQTSLAVFKQNWNEMKTMDTLQLETLRKVSAHQVQDTSGLNEAINFLSGNIAVNFMNTEEMKRKVISLYGLAAATKLLWIKLALLLDNSPEASNNKIKSGYLHTLITIGDEAVAHIDAVTQAIDKEIADRGARVQPCKSGHYTISVLGSSSTTSCVAFQDPDAPWNDYTAMTDGPHFSEMVTPNQGCCGQYPQTETCQSKRAAYIAKVQGAIRDRYGYDHDAIATMRQGLVATLDAYRPYLHH